MSRQMSAIALMLLVGVTHWACDDGDEPVVDQGVAVDGALDGAPPPDAARDMSVVSDAAPIEADRGVIDAGPDPVDRGERDMAAVDMLPVDMLPPDQGARLGRSLLRATVRLNLGPAQGEVKVPFRARGGGFTITGRLR